MKKEEEHKRIIEKNTNEMLEEFDELCGKHLPKGIDYNKRNNSVNNLIAFCNFCNSSVNMNREEWTKQFQEVLNG